MSRIEELIEKLCPNGVEYKELEKVCRFQNGFSFKSTLFRNCGEPILRITNILNGKLSDDSYVYFNLEDYKENLENYKVKKGDIVVAMSGATTGKIGYNYSENIYYLNQRVGLFVPNEKVLLKRFLFHWLTTQSKKIHNISSGSGAQPNLSSVKMMKLRIPVPPLEVQCEIVHILDDFTLLSAELSAELKARQKQYEYYASKLFTSFKAKDYPMGELAKFVYGYTDKSIDNGNTRFIRITDINEQGCLKKDDIKYINMNEEAQKSLLKKGDLVMARTGATFGKTLYFDDDVPSVYASFLIKIIPDNTKLLNKYYWHFTKTQLYWSQANKLVTNGGQPQFNTPALKKIRIPIPTIDEQHKVVDILDRLDKICNDISEGLPAEIEARKKQYEYYRDKLLTFKELKVNE